VRRAALVLVSLVLALAGCGGDDEPEQTPEAFVTTLIRQLGSGQAGSAWEELHPEHREQVPRPLYVRCEKGDGFGGEVTKIDVLEVKPEPATVPGTFGERPSTAVTVGITLKVPEVDEPERFSMTAHVFETDGRWSWVIGPVDFASYLAGRCPAQG
jgi:hypothetical protein